MKNTKRALLTSLIALIVCVTMLVGTTYAWFTDYEISAGNKIVAGNLDVELILHTESGSINIGETSAPIFSEKGSLVAKNDNDDTLWEPGKTQVAYLEIKNNGNLALKYQVAIEAASTDGKNIQNVLRYAIAKDADVNTNKVTTWDAANSKAVALGTNVDTTNVVIPKGGSHKFALAIHMDEAAGNEYQDAEISFDIKVLATQAAVEDDVFGTTYDAEATYPVA